MIFKQNMEIWPLLQIVFFIVSSNNFDDPFSSVAVPLFLAIFFFFPYNFLSFSYNSLCCSTIFSFFYNFLSFAMLRTVSKQQFSRLCILFTGSLRVFCSIAVSEHTIYDDFNHCPLFAGLIIATSLCLSSAILITSTKKTTLEFCALFVICITWVLIRWVDLNE